MKQSPMESVQNTKEVKKVVSKIHFLIHPGSINNFKNFTQREENTPENLDQHYERYLEKAKILGENEIMFAFAPANKKNFRDDFRDGTKDYVNLLKKLKKILGQKLFVLTDDLENWAHTVTTEKGAENTLPEMRKLVAARGYQFDTQMLSEIYGELIQRCVNDAGNSLNKTMNLENPTAIKTQLTDMPLEITPQGKILNESLKHNKPDNFKPAGKRVFFDFT